MKFNILIIDDEQPVREAIKILGLWEELKVDKIFEASNGRQALDILDSEHIDLVLVDMKMPEMDGMKLLQIMEEKYPELMSIVISGYQDFDYTRQAIRSKVSDYILKPVNRHELNASLKKAVDTLRMRKAKDREVIHQNITLNLSLPKLKEKLYLSILDRTYKSHNYEELIDILGLKISGYRYVVITMRLLNHDEVMKLRFKDDFDLLGFAVSNVIQEVSGYDCFSFVNPKQRREMITIISVEEGQWQEAAYHLHQQMSKLVNSLGDLFHLQVAIGIGQSVAAFHELAVSFDQSKKAVSSLNLYGKSENVIAYEEPTRNTAMQHHSILLRRTQIKQALDAGNRQLLHRYIRETTTQWTSEMCFTIEEADRVLDDLIIVLNDLAIELGVSMDQLPIGVEDPMGFLHLSGDFVTYAEFEERLHDLVERYYELVEKVKLQSTSFKITEIKSFIDQNYFEDIKISMFADKYYLSREYLMKLFKQAYGYGIHEYVQKVRMEKAQELLLDTQLKIQEVAEMLGYKDTNYFSKAFRNYFDCSPTEYRNQMVSSEGKR